MKLVQVSTNIFDQLTDVCHQLTPDEYAQPVDLLFGASVGKHMRHSIECYALALASYRTGHINYDRRVRQPELETDPLLAVETMRFIMRQLPQCTDDCTLRFEASYSIDAEPDVSISSTFYRELLYNIEHTIHHSAIIRIGLEKLFPHVRIPANFGVAYATVQHQMAV